MTTFYKFDPGPGTVGIRAINNINIEFHGEAGELLDIIFRFSLTAWDYLAAAPFGVGDSLTDQLTATSGNDLVFWDWETVSDSAHANPVTVRYFLPSGNQVQAIDIFLLGDGNDVFNLTYDASVAGFQSYDFNATAYGGTGNDLMMSGGGNDGLYGGEGLDTVFGGAGNDTIDLRGNVAEALGEFGYGGSGDDQITGDEGNDSLSGGSDNDRLEGLGGLDTLEGDAGNDTIYGGDGGNNISSGDVLSGGSGDDILYGGFGADNLIGESGFLDRMFGDDGNDQISDSDGIVLMSGGAGDDIMFSNFSGTWTAAGNLATVYGGGGSDTLSMNSAQQNLNLVITMDDGSADSTDTVTFSNVANSYNTSTATLGGGNDGYRGSLGGNGTRTDRVAGEAGNDTLYGGAGSDTLDGGTGFLDFLMGGTQTALAADAGDVLVDSDGVAYARAGEGDDTLTITFASNWVGTGGNASDLVSLDGNGGGDLFTLGSGNAAQRLIINADDGSADGNDSVNWAAASSYAAVTATLGDGSDVYNAATTGGSGTRNDTVYGGGGSDTIYGGAGFLDALYGGAQTALASDAGDVIVDSDGVVYARGGEGDDSFNITFASNWVGSGGNAGDLVTLDGNGGADSFILFSGNAALRLVINTDEGVANGNDVVNWSGAASSYDVVTVSMLGGDDNYIGTGPGGGTGNRIDIVYGGIGNDTLSGGIGDDTLFGSNAGNAVSDGGDSLFGRGGNDTLSGGYGIDTLDGGAENDVLVFNADNTVVGDNDAQDYVQGWDGSTQLAQHGYNGRTVNWSFDTFEGNTGTDSLVGTSGDDVLLGNTDDLYINGAGQTSNSGRMAGIEIVMLGAGADIFVANDPNGNTTSGTVFTTSLTVYGGDGSDAAYTGNGADLLVGDETVGGADVLAGGGGNDTIWGDLQNLADSTTGARDSLYGGSGNDTIFGGAGQDSIFGGDGTDTINAGTGDDYVVDISDTALLFGGDGADTFLLGYTNSTQSLAVSSTGADAVGDGADRVYIWVSGGGLQYDSISLSLGAGNDVFITGDVVGGNGIDRIMGESGNDVISSWNGNDVVDGGAGGDALWGGAGGDTIYGGPGDDVIYPGAGNNDVVYGGTGIDYYYWSRTDGAGDQIFDEFRGVGGSGQQAVNALVVFPQMDVNGVMASGTGVFETDHLLTDNIGGNDMVQLVDIDGAGGTLWRLDVLSGAGAGSSVTFDQRDIQGIALWNNEPTGMQQVVQYYEWDANAGTYVYMYG